MESLLNLPHGLMFWTVVNFGIFLFILIKFSGKGIVNALKSREESIHNEIVSAAEANAKAQQILKESQDKIDNAQQEISILIQKGKEQADLNIRKAIEAAEKVKKAKVEEAVREIERSKEQALVQLRTEVADMVVMATEKLLLEKIDRAKDFQLVENYIDKLPKN
jgi:F-type H+-transporting ATPase subunit b